MLNFAPNLLKDRRFLVTGATGGAGRATAMLLADCGGLVTCLGRDPERTEKVRRELSGGGHSTVQEGLYHGVFHAAGHEHIAPTALLNTDAFASVFEPSVVMAFELARDIGARKSIMRDGGAFVMMSSVAAVCGSPGMTIYSASKGAIEGLMRSAAVEWAGRRVRCNVIRAGAFASPMHSRIAARATPDSLDDYARRHPLGFGHAEDIAHMAVYLLSDMGKWITGASITVDGGYSAK